MNIDMSTNTSLAQGHPAVLVDLDGGADTTHWWQRPSVIAAAAEVRGMAIDLARLAVLPTAAGYAVVHAGHRAALMVAPDHATNMPHSIPVAAHDFAVAGRDLLAGIVDSGLALALLVAIIACAAVRGLLSAHAPVTAAIWWSARAAMPPFFFVVTVSVGAHLAVPHWLAATPFLAFLVYVAMIEAPLIRRAPQVRRCPSERER